LISISNPSPNDDGHAFSTSIMVHQEVSINSPLIQSRFGQDD